MIPLKHFPLHLASLAAALLSLAPLSTQATTFVMDQVTDVVAPSTRSTANTTHFGWELFDAGPIDDSTPDIGTTTTGVKFKTANGENHRSGSGNLYVGTPGNSLYEQVTVATSGTVGTTGSTTIIAQFVTAFGDFPGPITMGQINGVIPQVVRGINAAGEGHVWAVWQIPGNAASYDFTITGPNSTTAYSIDRIVVDTHWSSAPVAVDVMEPKSPPTFKLNQQSVVIAPTTRGRANTTYFGWDTFCEVGFDNVPINDTTPDIGTTTTGVSFVTTNAEDHISSSRNLYVGFGTLSEEITVVTDGTVDSGFTTVIAQAITAFGGFPSSNLTFSAIEGVNPEVIVTTNLAAKGQVWAKWKIPGNKASYTFTVTAPTGQSGWSFDKFVVDTYWNATSYQPDTVTAGNPVQNLTMDQLATVVMPSSRGNANTTYFGWDTFCEVGFDNVPINDTTPDIGTTTTGVSFVTTNAEDHVSSSRNLYVGSGTLAEEVTVATSGTVGTSGSTTIIAQAITAFGPFPADISFGDISGVSPTVVQTINATGKGQAWARWVIPGNAASYTFTVSGPTGISGYSFDKFIVDTEWKASGSTPDTMRATTPPTANVLGELSNAAITSSRGNVKTTHFGWETFNDIVNRNMGVSVIDDSTPDIGYTTTSGARFRTTNSEGHVLSSGNFYFIGGTLAEQITVPTAGSVGTGFTTVILQLVSATGAPGGDNGFAAPIALSINGAPPTSLVDTANGEGAGQLWAKWEIEGNAATYDIVVAGPANQAHFSFDRVVVDTFWSPTAYLGDSMAAQPPSITSTSPLAVAGVGSTYSAQLAATGGTAPYAFSLSAGTLSAGLTLDAAGLVSGSATTAGSSNFTVLVTDDNGLTATKAFDLTVTTSPSITTTSPLLTGVVGNAYTVTLAATGGTTAYEWSVSSGSLPAGLTLNSATGELSGTPIAAGTGNFTIQVEDANALIATQSFSVNFFDLTITTPSSLPGAVVGVPYSLTLTATGGTLPYAWTVSSGTLPTGLTLSAAGVISGTPTAAAAGSFTVQLTDDEDYAVTKVLNLTVFASLQTPVVNPISFGSTTVGAPFTYTVSATNYPAGFTITGLPKGLTAAPKTGVITGRPAVTGVFMVQVKAANKGGSSATVTAPLVVKALPISQIGSFTGIIHRDVAANQNLGGCLTLSTTAAGTFSGSLKSAGKTTALKGSLSASAPQVQLTVNGSSLAITIDPVTGALSGTHGAAAIEGWRAGWNALYNPASTREGYYSVGLKLGNPADDGLVNIPQGSGFATVTVTAAGVAAVKGQTADGQAITVAGPLGANGEILIYTSLYKNKGSVLGLTTLDKDPNGLFVENSISGELTWLKPTDTSKAYATQFGPTELNVFGKYLATSPKGQVVLGLPATGTADLLFTDGGLSASVTDPDVTGFTYTDANSVVMPLANPGKAKFSINKNTGAVTGEFTLVETTPPLTRKVKFHGQIVRPASGSSKAVGYFLLPQIGGATVLSGGVVIEQ